MSQYIIIISILILVPVATRIYLLSPQSPLHRSLSVSAFLIGLLGIVEYLIAHETSIEKVEFLALIHSSLALFALYAASYGSYYFAVPYSKKWKNWGFYIILILSILPILVVFSLFFKGVVLDMNHQYIDGKWKYEISKEGVIPYIYTITFILLELYLSISHLVVFLRSKYKKERTWKLILFITFTIIPFYVIFVFLLDVSSSKLGNYIITPYLTIIIIIIGWIYTNFKLFEINPISAIDNILELMSNVIIITDTDFTIKYLDESIELFGSRQKEFLGDSLIALADKYGQIPQENFKTISQLKEKEKMEKLLHLNLRGLEMHLLSIVSPVFNYQKEKVGYLFLQMDLTEDTKNRNKLKKYTDSLERSNKELERFAYIASHDMKTPLRNIVSFLNLLERKLKTYNDDQVHEYIGLAISNARYMHSLVQDILEFSKISETESSFKEVHLQGVILNVLQQLSNYIKEKNAIIEFEILPTIMANEVQMNQLFQNLIENGIKYNINESPTIKINVTQNETHLKIGIQDNGIGISEAYHEQIFDMFKRLHSDSDYKGTGIGLAICKKIIDLHNGKINVISSVDQGSKFILEFPATMIVNDLPSIKV